MKGVFYQLAPGLRMTRITVIEYSADAVTVFVIVRCTKKSKIKITTKGASHIIGGIYVWYRWIRI